MNDDRTDANLDAALTALARPEPPVGHLARVLARTGEVQNVDRVTAGGAVASTQAYARRRWLMPALAAGVLVVAATGWQIERATPAAVDEVLQTTATSRPSEANGGPDLNVPVLPPQAYWAMDAFDEFASLRPGPQRDTDRAQQRQRVGTQVRARGASASRGGRPLAAPQPSGLPPIELEDISPAPVDLPELASLEDLAFAELQLTPIVIAPITEEEKP